MQKNVTSQVFPVVLRWVPYLSDAVALAVKLLPSTETTMDRYCFVHYMKLVVVAPTTTPETARWRAMREKYLVYRVAQKLLDTRRLTTEGLYIR